MPLRGQCAILWWSLNTAALSTSS